ncbi:MAG: hypothetical protein V4614_01130 [Pseudomonadota bacterium]
MAKLTGVLGEMLIWSENFLARPVFLVAFRRKPAPRGQDKRPKENRFKKNPAAGSGVFAIKLAAGHASQPAN